MMSRPRAAKHGWDCEMLILHPLSRPSVPSNRWPRKGFRYSRLVRPARPDPITSTVRCIAHSSTGQSSWSRRLHPKTISPLLLVLGRCGWPGLNAPSPFPPPCIRMVSIGLPAAPGKALGRPAQHFPMPPRCNAHQRHWQLAAGPILTRETGAELALRVPAYPSSGYVDAMHQVVSQPTSIHWPVLSVPSRGRASRELHAAVPQSSCRLGSRLMRLETSPLISSLARGSLGGQASWPPDTVLSIQFLVCLWWFLAHTRAAGPCHCRLALSCPCALCSILRVFVPSLFDLSLGGGASTAPAGRPSLRISCRQLRTRDSSEAGHWEPWPIGGLKKETKEK